jgi:predicted secreted protein
VTIRMPLVTLCLLLAAPLGARAQAGSDLETTLARLLGRQQPTVLELSETTRRDVAQDELAATLYARAQAAEPGPAQSEVNQKMRDALAKARAAQGIRVTSGGYNVHREQPSENVWVWIASQELDLVAADGERLLGLVGELQGMGLAVQDLQWRVADATRLAAERALLTDSLQAMEATARTAADGLGLVMSGWRRVSLVPNEMPMPRYRAAPMAMAAEAAAPPVAAAGTIELTVTVTGEALLVAR